MQKQMSLIVIMMILTFGNVAEGADMNELVYEVIAREATTGCFDDYVAVARLIKNRVELGWWGKTVKDVIYYPNAFYCINFWDQQVARTDEQLEWAKRAWDIANTMETDFPATHMLKDNEYWIENRPKWMDKLHYLTKVGKHNYLKETRF